MKAPRPESQLPALVRLYSLALCLYPASFRSEYAEEMQVIFRLRLEDALNRGRSAFLGFACKEALTFPSGVAAAHAQARKGPNFFSFILDIFNYLSERGSKMSIRRLFPVSTEPTPWPIAILSLVPFILIGPLTQLLSYHPWWDPKELPSIITAARVPVTIGLLVVGFLIAILKKFPRWSYLYGPPIVFLVPFGIIYLIDQTLFPIIDNAAGWIILPLIILTIIACRFLPFLRPFFTNIRQDWTLLSYALFACAFFLLASNDKDESPVYNLQVLLPSLIACLGALGYLVLGDPLKKVAALLGAVLFGVLIWWWPVLINSSRSLGGQIVIVGFLLGYWAVLGGLILAPIATTITFRRTESMG